MIGMHLVGQRGLDVAELEGLVEGGRRGLETARKLIGLLRNVIAVEGVEPDVAIAVLCEKRFPSRPGRRHRVWCERFDHHHLRPIALPVAVEQHVLLGALNVDFEKVECARCVLLAEFPERRHRDDQGFRSLSELTLRGARMVFDHGREAVEVVHDIEGGFARGRADEGFEMTIAWPHRPASDARARDSVRP